VLAIKGIIYPAANSHVSLRAKLCDGTWVDGETRITASRKRIHHVYLEPSNAEPLDGALEAIAGADIITLGPGSLYTSLIPNLLVNKIIDAIQESHAAKIYIQNIMTQPGETDGLTAADHVQALIDHSSNQLLFPRILLNTGVPSSDLLAKYRAEGAELVEVDRERLASLGMECAEDNLLAQDGVIRHDPNRLGQAVYKWSGF
jgi:uncharacterized cofD-like protein